MDATDPFPRPRILMTFTELLGDVGKPQGYAPGWQYVSDIEGNNIEREIGASILPLLQGSEDEPPLGLTFRIAELTDKEVMEDYTPC